MKVLRDIREPCDRCGKLKKLTHRLHFAAIRDTHRHHGADRLPSAALCENCVREVIYFIWPNAKDFAIIWI